MTWFGRYRGHITLLFRNRGVKARLSSGVPDFLRPRIAVPSVQEVDNYMDIMNTEYVTV